MTSAASASSTSTQELWNELMHFYIDEAWMLDERRYVEWLDLLTDDLFYFMPRRKNVYRREIEREILPPGQMSLMEETKANMELRVARLETGMAWAEDPPSRTRHIVGNLVVKPQDNGEVHTRTAFLVYRSHLEYDQDIYSGYREDVLRKTEAGWKIARRTIVLDANVILTKNISVFF